MILPKENLNMTMEILGEVSVGADTMIKVPENASMTVQILDEVKDNERVPVQGLITNLLTFFVCFLFSVAKCLADSVTARTLDRIPC